MWRLQQVDGQWLTHLSGGHILEYATKEEAESIRVYAETDYGVMGLVVVEYMFTVGDVLDRLAGIPRHTWVCVGGAGPVVQIQHEPGAAEPFIVLLSKYANRLTEEIA